MDNSQKKTYGGTSDVFVSITSSAFDALADSPGRRGVRIFGLPREQLIMAIAAALLLGIPLAIIVAMAPFWDSVGDFWLLKEIELLRRSCNQRAYLPISIWSVTTVSFEAIPCRFYIDDRTHILV
jgi:hypothetical protein